MQSARPPARRPLRPRHGFTLVELLVVIVVIAILIGLLIPAVINTIRTAREAQVVTEMSSLDAALVNFRSKYGVEVPSFIVLYENGAQWDPSNPAGIVADVAHRESRAFIRQCWPDFSFNYDTDPAVTAQIDINGDGDTTDVLILDGAECLVFFLGGVCETNVVDQTGALKGGASAGDPITWWNPLGFSANPQFPFARGGNRVEPFANFDAGQNGRVRDFFPTGTGGDSMPEYFDSLPGQLRPLLYLSSYGGRGYRPAGPDGVDGTADDELPRPTSAGGTEAAGIGNLYFSDSSLTTPHNPNSYQLISPGLDFEYGAGGEYNGSAATGKPLDRDNITNFKKGRLN